MMHVKILVVDDKKENLYLQERMLTKIGYEVVMAENGKQALEKLYSDNFQMVISDILMPVMDGFQLCKTVRSDTKFSDLLFVFYTATYVAKEDEELALKLGADLFLRKPLEPEKFIEIIKNLVHSTETTGDKGIRVIDAGEAEIYKLYNKRLVQKLEKKMFDLENEITIRHRKESDLKKRVNELTCLYSVSSLSNEYNISLEEFIRKILVLIPPAWQFPSITCARIIYKGHKFETENFRETKWRLKVDIKEYEKIVGSFEVFYLEEKPIHNDELFLTEERNLLNAIVEIFRQFTEGIRSGQALKDSQTKLYETFSRAEFYKDLFAHDINNILQCILLGIESLSEDKEFHPLKEDIVNMMLRQVRRGAKLAKNVRKLARLEKNGILPESLELLPIIKDVISSVKRENIDRELDIVLEAPEKHISVLANKYLKDVFLNILDNAITHNTNQTVKIVIKISRDQIANREYIKMEFIDNGIGIEDSRKDKIFRRQTTVYGIGLGLSFVNRIIDTLNGQVWVENRIPGDYTKGSNFLVIIPVRSS